MVKVTSTVVQLTVLTTVLGTSAILIMCPVITVLFQAKSLQVIVKEFIPPNTPVIFTSQFVLTVADIPFIYIHVNPLASIYVPVIC